jgi:hypothetical protein
MNRTARTCLVIFLVLASALISMASAANIGVQPLTAAQEAAVIGGSRCSMAAGFSLGITIGGIFGCFVCEIGAAVIDVGMLIYC